MMPLRDHSEQIAFVCRRDGVDASIAYARQTLAAYRGAARPAKDGKKTFAHAMPFRPHFVASILHIRRVLRENGS